MPTDHAGIPVVLARLGHALGGPTYLLARPDRRVVIRMAFDAHELEVDASSLDEPVGILLRDGSMRVLDDVSSASIRLAYGAKVDGHRIWLYSGQRDGDRAVWARATPAPGSAR